ncbi:MAG TPA: hypothetical protein GX401_02170 [Clostridiales bacterium]|nr:hypothetical protein [Clostridiales bacterium]
MVNRVPWFYKDFNCIGSGCTDNCCIGWEIDIDNKTNSFYQGLNGSFGERLHSCINNIAQPSFILNDERCPFLNNENLCDVIINLGEKHLCEICKNHPRFYEWFDNLTELGIGLCCEEGCRLLFSNDEPVKFVTFETDDENQNINYDNELFSQLILARDTILAVLQNRNIPLLERFALTLTMGEDIQDCIEMKKYRYIKDLSWQYKDENFCSEIITEISKGSNCGLNKTEFVKDVLQFLNTLEPINDQWKNSLTEISNKLPVIMNSNEKFDAYHAESQYEYEHIAVYFIYRYFLKAVFDEDVVSKVKLAVVSCVVNYIFDINSWIANNYEFTLLNRIANTKAYSKEVEYSEENLGAFFDACYINDIFSYEKLVSMLLD